MKKLIAILLCLSMLLALVACGEKKVDNPDIPQPGDDPQANAVQSLWEDDGPKKDVYKLAQTVYKNLSAGSEGKMVIEFDEKGQILGGINNADDDYEVKAQVEFNDNGFPAAVKVTIDGKEWDTVTLIWDPDGNLAKKDFAQHNDQDCDYTYNRVGAVLTERMPGHYVEYVYDADGFVVSQREYRDGVLREKRDSSYAHGLMTECKKNSFDSNGNLSAVTTETYDQYGNLTQSRTDYMDETQTDSDTHYEYTYDDKGNMLSNDFYREGQFMYGYTYTYDADGNRTAEWADGVLQYESAYSNNGQNVKTTVYRDGDEVTGTREYTYDAQGNELSYKKFDKDGKAINERTSTYKTFSLTERQTRVFEAMLELLSELEVYDD